MKKFVGFMVVMLILATLVTGCGQSAPAASGSSEGKSAEKEVVLKVAFFKGGFGDAWFNWLKEEFEKTRIIDYPNKLTRLVGL